MDNLDKNLISLKGSNFLSITDLNHKQFISLLDLASKLKKKKILFDYSKMVLGLIFEKSSTRTRVSFQVAMNNLNGSTIDLSPRETQIGRGEPIKDTARVLTSYLNALAIRTFDQSTLEEYAKWSKIPIINALTDLEHPCQILADFLTIKEEFGDFNDLIISYVGDPNNVSNSLILGGAILGIQVNIGCPKNLKPDKEIISKAYRLCKNDNKVKIYNDPKIAVSNANVIYTDVWASMGQEKKASQKEKLFKEFTVNKELIKEASANHIVLHCLPAYRGKEISDEVMESNASRIFVQSENRLHVQQALLAAIFG